MYKKIRLFILIIFILLNFSSVVSSSEFFPFNLEYDDEVFQKLMNEYNKISSFKEMDLWINRVKNLFFSHDDKEELINLFSILAEEEKPFIQLLYLNLSDLYSGRNNNKASILYLSKVDKKFYRESYNNNFIGYYIAKKIINSHGSSSGNLAGNFKLKEAMFKLLLTDFQDQIDIPYTYFELANLYKSNLDMDKAVEVMDILITHYRNDLEADIKIEDIKKEINYYKLEKNWVMSDLEGLINNIKETIIKKDLNKLTKYVSKEGFEIKIFQKIKPKTWSFNELGISQYWNQDVEFSKSLEDFSTENKVYLKTENWAFPVMSTWYFCFTKIDYPYDPSINGGWEWKGIYFGAPF